MEMETETKMKTFKEHPQRAVKETFDFEYIDERDENTRPEQHKDKERDIERKPSKKEPRYLRPLGHCLHF